MNLDRADTLRNDGFEHVTTMNVGVPHFVWVIDLDIELDRDLRLLEETVLRLVAADAREPSELQRLLGLDDSRMLATTIAVLLEKGALVPEGDGLALREAGRQMLARAAAREVRTYESKHLWHDPYRDELYWSEGDELQERDARRQGLRLLPHPDPLREGELARRYGEIQTLVERAGLPFDKDVDPEKRRCEVLRVRPLRPYRAYRPAELEVWHHAGRDAWEWRLLREGGEDVEASEALKALEHEGQTIIPLEEQMELSSAGKKVHETVEEIQRTRPVDVLEAHEHREALREAIEEAQRHLIVVAPWVQTPAVNDELLGWLRKALDKRRSLRVTIGWGIGEDKKRAPSKAKVEDQRRAIRRLNELGSRFHGRLETVEIGYTHEKVVICDDRFAIVTSFNFLSYNPRPNKGVRRETGLRITDKEAVRELRRQLEAVLKR